MQVGQVRDLVGEDRAAGAPSRGPAVHARCEDEVALAPPRTAGLCRVRGLEMFNACMSGSTSSLEVLQSHLGGARGPDAVDVLAEALLSSLPQPAADVPAYEAWPLVNARASLMSAGGRSFVDRPASAHRYVNADWAFTALALIALVAAGGSFFA